MDPKIDKRAAPGDVYQLDPERTRNRAFAGCMLVCTEPKTWGVQGFVQALGDSRDTPGGLAYYRATWDEIQYVGRAVWMPR